MNFYRISVSASSLSMWCNEETAVLCSARITARLTGQSLIFAAVAILQLLNQPDTLVCDGHVVANRSQKLDFVGVELLPGSARK